MIDATRRTADAFLRILRRRIANWRLPLSGYANERLSTPYVELLDDNALAELNRLLPWHSFTVDGLGRRFGAIAWGDKRSQPQRIPDDRIVKLDHRFPLKERTVLEIGCFEGVHTTALCQRAALVKAIDGRIENVVKTLVRCAGFGQRPLAFVYDIERTPSNLELLQCDVCHHVGVLYHLRDPVTHLLDLGNYVLHAVMLDTHVATKQETMLRYTAAGREWAYKRYIEYGAKDPFSGMYSHSKWLTLEDLITLLKESGFPNIDVTDYRIERNGPRVLIFAAR